MEINSNHAPPQIVADEQALAAVLEQRDTLGGAEFWLADQSEGLPCLALVVSGPTSHATYFPAKGHPGFRCLRPAASEPFPCPDTLFVWVGCDPASGEWVPGDFVVPVCTSLAAAREFFRNRSLPSSMQWFEL